MRTWAIIGCVGMFTGVAIGAFGAHELEGMKDGWSAEDASYYLEVWGTGSQYHLLHGLAMFMVAWSVGQGVGKRMVNAAGVLLAVGTVIFSGSLYVLVLTEVGRWGAVTPIGGVMILAGWFVLGLGWVLKK